MSSCRNSIYFCLNKNVPQYGMKTIGYVDNRTLSALDMIYIEMNSIGLERDRVNWEIN
jgi:hypothetical protein